MNATIRTAALPITPEQHAAAIARIDELCVLARTEIAQRVTVTEFADDTEMQAAIAAHPEQFL